MDRALATRHVMQANKSKNTKPELMVRAALREAGESGYRLHWKKAAGRPDICYPGRKLAIFVQGCYWHRCPWCTSSTPRTNTAFWEEKFARNRARDERDQERLCADGWTVVVVRECRLKKGRGERTLEEVAELVGKARETAGQGRLVEVGAPSAWKLARARARILGTSPRVARKRRYHR